MPDLLLHQREIAYDDDVVDVRPVWKRQVTTVHLSERNGVRSLLETSVGYKRGISTGGKPYDCSDVLSMQRLTQTKGGYLVYSSRSKGRWYSQERVFAEDLDRNLFDGINRQVVEQ